MPLLPHLSVIEGESLTSYLNRNALFHCNIGLSDFLRIFEISQQDAMLPTSKTIEKVSRLTGAATNDLEKMTAKKTGKKIREIAGQIVHPNSLHLSVRQFCPFCLLEDGEPESPSQGVFVGRSAWQMQSIRLCSTHGIVLPQYNAPTYPDRFQLLPEIFSKNVDLGLMSSQAEYQEPSDLEQYILRRINGFDGPDWLDGQRMDLAARACEMLGIILIHGADVNLKNVTKGQWAIAGHVGFGFASRGERGIREGLSVVCGRHVDSMQSGGAQKAFGRLYQWLQFSSQSLPRGDIRHAVREFILDHFPFETGKNLFGEPVSQRRVHSINSLANKSPFSVRAVQHAAEVTGLVTSGKEGGLTVEVFTAQQGEVLMQKMVASMPMNALPAYLNCNRIQAEQLVRSGIIPRMFPAAKVQSGILTNVSIACADVFLEKFMGKAQKVRVRSNGMMDIVSAAQSTHVSVIDTIQAILSGDLHNIEIVDPNLQFKGVLVDPAEIRAVLCARTMKGFVWKAEAADIIGISMDSLSRLSKMQKINGDVYFTELFFEAEGLRSRPMYSLDEVHAFKRKHILIGEYAAQLKLPVQTASALLRKRRIRSIAPRNIIGRKIYRRADLEFV